MPKEMSFLFSQTILIFKLLGNHFVITVEALMSGHPCHVKKVSLTRAGCFWECKNAEFVWELRTMVFCESGRK